MCICNVKRGIDFGTWLNSSYKYSRFVRGIFFRKCCSTEVGFSNVFMNQNISDISVLRERWDINKPNCNKTSCVCIRVSTCSIFLGVLKRFQLNNGWNYLVACVNLLNIKLLMVKVTVFNFGMNTSSLWGKFFQHSPTWDIPTKKNKSKPARGEEYGAKNDNSMKTSV